MSTHTKKSKSPTARKIKIAIALLSAIGVLLLAAGIGYYIVNMQVEEDIVAEPVVEQMEEVAEVFPEEPEEPEENIIKGVVKSGTTASTLLEPWLDRTDMYNFIEACSDVFALNKLRAGQSFVVTENKQGMMSFEYEIDANSKLIVERDESDAFTAVVEPIVYDIELIRITGDIQSSLFNSMADLGESPALAVMLADIFAWEINFIRDIQKDDSFSILVEKRSREGEFKGYGRVLGATFINRGKLFEAYVFNNSYGRDQFYNANGESVKRAFLKAPLSYSRISSRFNLNRMHPILKKRRPHPAVDYAAPQGTPIKSVGDGVVTFVGRSKGAGNYVKVNHPRNYETMYLHMSRFAKGLKKGQRVAQGQVIGYVGSTGYSTGPHLDFRMKHNGKWVNPETTLSPRSEPLNKEQMKQFLVDRDVYRKYLSGEKDLADYTTGLQKNADKADNATMTAEQAATEQEKAGQSASGNKQSGPKTTKQ